MLNEQQAKLMYNFNVFILHDEFRVHESHWSFI